MFYPNFTCVFMDPGRGVFCKNSGAEVLGDFLRELNKKWRACFPMGM